MIKIKFLIFLLVFPFFLFSQNKLPFKVGESCTYRIHYGPITAGYGRLTIKNLEQYNNVVLPDASNPNIIILYCFLLNLDTIIPIIKDLYYKYIVYIVI